MSSYESRQVRAVSLRALPDKQLAAAQRALEAERVPFTLDALRAHSEAYEDVLAEVTRRRFARV